MPISETQIILDIIVSLLSTSITTLEEIISVTEVDPLTGQNFSPVYDSFNESFTENIFDFQVFPLTESRIEQIGSYFDEVAEQFIGSSNNIVEADNGIVAQNAIIAQPDGALEVGNPLVLRGLQISTDDRISDFLR